MYFNYPTPEYFKEEVCLCDTTVGSLRVSLASLDDASRHSAYAPEGRRKINRHRTHKVVPKLAERNLPCYVSGVAQSSRVVG